MREGKISDGNCGSDRVPVVREKFYQLIHGMSIDAGQHVAEIVEHVDTMTLAGGDEAEEDRGGVATVFGSQERPVAAAHGNAAQGAFGGVVVDGQIAVCGVDAQRVPLVEGVGDGRAHGTLGQHRSALGRLPGFQPRAELLETRQGFLPAQGRTLIRRQLSGLIFHIVKQADIRQGLRGGGAVGIAGVVELAPRVRLMPSSA